MGSLFTRIASNSCRSRLSPVSLYRTLCRFRHFSSHPEEAEKLEWPSSTANCLAFFRTISPDMGIFSVRTRENQSKHISSIWAPRWERGFLRIWFNLSSPLNRPSLIDCLCFKMSAACVFPMLNLRKLVIFTHSYVCIRHWSYLLARSRTDSWFRSWDWITSIFSSKVSEVLGFLTLPDGIFVDEHY